MISMRPSDLAREHGLSTQAVRNYERDGFLPAAERTRSGYRVYTAAHAAALRAFLALVPAYGHSAAGRIMRAVHEDALDDALTIVDRGHAQLLRDRETLDAVRDAVDHLTAEPTHTTRATHTAHPLTVGELAHRLDVTPATLRNWEDAGILTPARDPLTGYRLYRPADVRDAELAHLLRRGDHPLDHIATVVRQIRTAGGTDALSAALDDWRRRLTVRGLAMLDASAHLSRYLTHLDHA
ncbi:MerR family DNA-binding transcriptional regulator [Streptomyces sp. ND05-3B]|nr:MerR family DNA-binding transcriptional regulator [Streptomyces caniscabiei]MBE4756838.1 MerR family DNA-binding transcriptional regulator [Streptomyces caniscabiei]MBE4773778.1 MerR family DNA-binding transcriptional regulator [Streptomyces caniscabiei]MBE4785652.1 MerR family DNA-binding transcriptional regulator [Streptomyces caniscabiei]MBE4796995.1 MerR family DNA-binding transcriptional regulator [Streptomyces caniscabiei]